MTGALRDAMHRALGTGTTRWAVALLAFFTVLALVGPPFLADPYAMPNPVAGAQPPSAAHWLGTDALNRDVLARLVLGARVSLTVAALGVLLSVTAGTAVGVIAGYVGGLTDTALMRTVDAAMAIPRLFMLLLLTLVWERIPLGVFILAIGLTGWFSTSRLVRAEVLRLRHADFVRAAVALGAGAPRIVLRHLVPNVTGSILVAATLGVGDVILLEAGLSFLGVGVQPPTPSWGGMILDARSTLLQTPWISLSPGLAILATVLAANLVGDALRAGFDPRSA